MRCHKGAPRPERKIIMYIMDDGIRLNARIEMPEGKTGKCPLLIILHGFTGNMEEAHLTAVARAANAAGFAALRVDLYGHGLSGGEFSQHTLFKWMTNALTVIDYARGLDFVTDIYLCGHSQGGLTAMLAAGMKWDQIKGLIALSPACMIPELARTGVLLGENFDPLAIPDTLPAWGGRVLDSNYVRVAQMIRVEEYIDRYPGPVLVVHGDADGAVPPRYGIEAAKRYQNSRLVLIPGDGHCYEYHTDKMAAAVGAWLRERKAADTGDTMR